MNVQEIEREIENVEKVAASNTDMRHVAGVLARGVWEIVLQLAILNRRKSFGTTADEQAYHLTERAQLHDSGR